MWHYNYHARNFSVREREREGGWIGLYNLGLKPSTGASKAIQHFEVKTKSERVDSKKEESKLKEG